MISRIALGGAKSAGYAAGQVGGSYFLYPKEYRPTKREIARDLTVAYAIGAIDYTTKLSNISKESKAQLDAINKKISADYENMVRLSASEGADKAALERLARNITAYNNVIDAALSGQSIETTIDGTTYRFEPRQMSFVGQQKYVDEIRGNLKTVTNSAQSILNGVSGGAASSGGASSAAAVMGTPQIPAAVPKAQASQPVTVAPKAASATNKSAPTAMTAVQNDPQKQKIIEEYNNSVDDGLLNFIEYARANKAVPDTKKHQLAVVSAYKTKAAQQALIMQTDKTVPPVDVRNVVADTAFYNSIPYAKVNVNNENGAAKPRQTPLLKDTSTSANEVARAVGAKVKTAEQTKGTAAKGKYERGAVYLTGNDESPTKTVLAHKMMSHLKENAPETYDAYVKMARDTLSSETGLSRIELWWRKKAQYAEQGIELSAANAEDELVSDFNMRILTDPNELTESIRNAKELNELQKVILVLRTKNAIKHMADQLENYSRIAGSGIAPSEISQLKNTQQQLERIVAEKAWNAESRAGTADSGIYSALEGAGGAYAMDSAGHKVQVGGAPKLSEPLTDVEDVVAPRRSVTGNGVDNGGESGIIINRGMAMGFRQPATRILTEIEIKELETEASILEIPLDLLRFNTGGRTSFNDVNELIFVCGDVLPDPSSSIARDRMTSRAVLAHEYYGHYLNRNNPTQYRVGDWRDEFRASRDAAIKAPGLTDEDRALLMIDAYDRAREAGQILEYDEIARRIIYGY